MPGAREFSVTEKAKPSEWLLHGEGVMGARHCLLACHTREAGA